MKRRIWIEGEGIPIVLIHGMGGPKIWLPIIEKLKERFQVIIPTLPGFCKEDSNFKYSDELYVEFLIRVREYLSIQKWNVVGLSMGGRTAINYGMVEVDKISSLTLIDSIGVGYMSPLLRLPLMKIFFPFFIRNMLTSKYWKNKLAEQDFVDITGEAFKNCMEWSNDIFTNKIIRQNLAKILSNVGIPEKQWETKLDNLNIPTQILWASEDKTAPLKWGEWLNSKIPMSNLLVLNGYKHMAIVENPDFFINSIIDFVTKKNYAA